MAWNSIIKRYLVLLLCLLASCTDIPEQWVKVAILRSVNEAIATIMQEHVFKGCAWTSQMHVYLPHYVLWNITG